MFFLRGTLEVGFQRPPGSFRGELSARLAAFLAHTRSHQARRPLFIGEICWSGIKKKVFCVLLMMQKRQAPVAPEGKSAQTMLPHNAPLANPELCATRHPFLASPFSLPPSTHDSSSFNPGIRTKKSGLSYFHLKKYTSIRAGGVRSRSHHGGLRRLLWPLRRRISLVDSTESSGACDCAVRALNALAAGWRRVDRQ